MKTIKKILLIFICVLLTTACSNDAIDLNNNPSLSNNDYPSNDAEIIASKKINHKKTISLPLKLKFTTLASPIEGGESCGPPPIFHIKLEGNGNGTMLGYMGVYCTVCVNQQTGEFIFMESDLCVFTSANGDELHGIIDGGRWGPSSRSDFDAELNGTFAIVGGTGKFKDATGEGLVSAFLTGATGEAINSWKGNINLAKKARKTKCN
jgi:hypothetical protein